MEGSIPVIAVVIAVICVVVVVLARRKNASGAKPKNATTKQTSNAKTTDGPKPNARYVAPGEEAGSGDLKDLGIEFPVASPPGPQVVSVVAQPRPVVHEVSESSKRLTAYKADFDACQNEEPDILAGAQIILMDGALTLKTNYTRAPLVVQIFLKTAENNMAYGAGKDDDAVRYGETGIEGHLQVTVPDWMVSKIDHAQVRVYNEELQIRAVEKDMKVEKVKA